MSAASLVGGGPRSRVLTYSRGTDYPVGFLPWTFHGAWEPPVFMATAPPPPFHLNPDRWSSAEAEVGGTEGGGCYRSEGERGWGGEGERREPPRQSILPCSPVPGNWTHRLPLCTPRALPFLSARRELFISAVASFP